MSVIQDIIKNEGDPDSWPVDVHEYTRQQTLFWESYLSFSNIHLLSNCQYPESGLAEDTASPPPDWARSWSQTNTGLTYRLRQSFYKEVKALRRGQRGQSPHSTLLSTEWCLFYSPRLCVVTDRRLCKQDPCSSVFSRFKRIFAKNTRSFAISET